MKRSVGVAVAARKKEPAKVVSLVPKLEDVRSLERAKKELISTLKSVMAVCMELENLKKMKDLNLEQQKKMADLERERTIRIGVLSAEMANIATIIKQELGNAEAREALNLIQRHPSQAIKDGAKAMLEMADMLTEKNK